MGDSCTVIQYGRIYGFLWENGENPLRRGSISNLFLRRVAALDLFFYRREFWQQQPCERLSIGYQGVLSPSPTAGGLDTGGVGGLSDRREHYGTDDGVVSGYARDTDITPAAPCAALLFDRYGSRALVGSAEREIPRHPVRRPVSSAILAFPVACDLPDFVAPRTIPMGDGAESDGCGNRDSPGGDAGTHFDRLVIARNFLQRHYYPFGHWRFLL